MHFKSLRIKLTLWYVLILGILLISFSSFLYFTLSKSLHRDVDNKLRSLAEIIGAESSSPLTKFGFEGIDQGFENSLNLKPIGKFVQVLDGSGNIGRKSANLKNIQLPISLNALKNASMGLVTFETNSSVANTPLRIITFPVIENNHITNIIQIASSLEEVEEALHKLLLILAITVPLALMVASLGGQFLAHQALKPVDEITRTARMITSQNLNKRIHPPKVKDEISRLVETFNEMISRLDQSFRKTKQFSSDASHELKTPLTILKGEIEVSLRKKRSHREYHQILESNLEEINRMSQIIENLLILSKADTDEIHLKKANHVNITDILDEVLAQMDRFAKAKGISLLTSNHRQKIYMKGDALRIRELLINLIDNGIKYTESGGSVRVLLEKEEKPQEKSKSYKSGEKVDQYVKLTVSDNGIGIDKEDQGKIFDRFFRVDKARSRGAGGSGLGLSICKWIVEAHQGEIRVESKLEKGSSFIVQLPVISS